MSRCVYMHTLPFHVCIGAIVHVSQVSQTLTKDIVTFVFTNTQSVTKYVTVCIHTFPFHLDIGAGVYVSQYQRQKETRTQDVTGITMGWLRVVGSIKL